MRARHHRLPDVSIGAATSSEQQGSFLRAEVHLAEGGQDCAKQLTTYFVGQAVGLMNQPISARQVVYDFMEDFATAAERMADLVSE